LGDREVSLPELETLALYLRVPLSYFLNPESNIQEELAPPQHPDKMKSMRALISERLKQARAAAGKSREECAQAAQIKPSTLSRYERGLADVPITELDRMAKFIGVDLFYFLQNESGAGSDLLDLEKLARLPADIRAFVLTTENVPYLRLAQKFRDIPAEKLNELGEVFLVVR
jgi:transcriptional regulator with XRE-family HTH domain